MTRQIQCVLYSLLALLVALPACGSDSPTALTSEDLAAVFTAAGFRNEPDGRWIRCQEDQPTLSYMPGRAEVADLNADGQPEVWITEGSTFCYGNTGTAFALLTRDSSGWRMLLDMPGMYRKLERKHDGWPDIEVGGPGFQRFPVYRWDGNNYSQLR